MKSLGGLTIKTKELGLKHSLPKRIGFEMQNIWVKTNLRKIIGVYLQI
jgi:hypothetical protein